MPRVGSGGQKKTRRLVSLGGHLSLVAAYLSAEGTHTTDPAGPGSRNPLSGDRFRARAGRHCLRSIEAALATRQGNWLWLVSPILIFDPHNPQC